METSTIYSMGTALDRAQSMGIAVEVLVSGAWLTGLVVTTDGHGVVLAADEGEHSVVRLDAIQAVRVHSPMPGRKPIPAQQRPY
ncbi:MAG TPA: hypothetical protein VFK34_12470 [Marmoricola sp.]|jgi:hypothetical protein|nr:hypothetical protein [Marmoricola sp.]